MYFSNLEELGLGKIKRKEGRVCILEVVSLRIIIIKVFRAGKEFFLFFIIEVEGGFEDRLGVL